MLISSFLDELYKKGLDFSQKKYWFLLLGYIFIIVLLINGVGIVPEEAFRRLSENPFTTRTDIHFNNYFQETLLLPLLAHYLHLTSRFLFNALCLFIIVASFSVFAYLVFKQWGAFSSLLISTLLITSPLTTTLLSWVGMPDGLTFGLIVPFLFTSSSGLIFFLAILGGTNHIIFIIACAEILLLRWVSGKGIKNHHILLAITGGLIGVGLVRIFLEFHRIELFSRMDFIESINLEYWFKQNFTNLPLSLASLFNFHWLVLFICFILFFNMDKRFFVIATLLLVINYSITFFTLDTTRVFSLLSWGVFSMTIFHSHRLSLLHSKLESDFDEQFKKTLLILALISIIAPRYFYWAGAIHSTPFFEIIARLSS